MGRSMRRRQFLSLVGAGALWPVAVRAQLSPVVIGILQIGASEAYPLAGFRRGLEEAGYVEGRNLTIEYRFANDDPDRLPKLAQDLVHRQVRAIVAIGSPIPVRAAMAATNIIPIIFGFGSNPVQLNIVTSLNRPGGNVTGMTSQSSELVGKQLGILRDVVPQATSFGMLIHATNPSQRIIAKAAEAAAEKLASGIEIVTVENSDEVETRLAQLAGTKGIKGVVVSNDPLFIADRTRLIDIFAQNRLPAIYPFRAQTEAGGLMSYGPDLADRDREVGHYVARVLNGEQPAELPVLQATKFEFILNVKTAKALGLTFSSGLLSIADEVLE
jgi:putative tryptophan/tyrosine transport system substrate-binding protein